MNLAHQFVLKAGSTIEGARGYWDGACIDFAGELIDSIGKGRLAYFNTDLNPDWKYHAAVVVDGVVHDLWQDSPIPLPEYLPKIGAVSVEYPAEVTP